MPQDKPQKETRRKTILLVDDDSLLNKALRNALEIRGYKVISCVDSLRAECILEETEVDYAIVDRSLGNLDGSFGLIRSGEKLLEFIEERYLI